MLVARFCDGGLSRRGVGDIANKANSADLFRDLGDRVGVHIQDRDFGPACSKGACRCGSQATATSGHECARTVQIHFLQHGFVSVKDALGNLLLFCVVGTYQNTVDWARRLRYLRDEEQFMSDGTLASVPLSARVLGFGGAIPFVGCAVLFWMAADASWAWKALELQIFYGCMILSFLGAVHWGAVLRDGADAEAIWARLGWSVTPALLAWLASLLIPTMALLTLILGVAAAYFMDLKARDNGWFPAWYLALQQVAVDPGDRIAHRQPRPIGVSVALRR